MIPVVLTGKVSTQLLVQAGSVDLVAVLVVVVVIPVRVVDDVVDVIVAVVVVCSVTTCK